MSPGIDFVMELGLFDGDLTNRRSNARSSKSSRLSLAIQRQHLKSKNLQQGKRDENYAAYQNAYSQVGPLHLLVHSVLEAELADKSLPKGTVKPNFSKPFAHRSASGSDIK